MGGGGGFTPSRAPPTTTTSCKAGKSFVRRQFSHRHPMQVLDRLNLNDTTVQHVLLASIPQLPDLAMPQVQLFPMMPNFTDTLSITPIA